MKKTFLAKRNALLSSTDISWGAYALIAAIFMLLLRLIAPNFFLAMYTPAFRAADAFAEKSHAFFNSFADTADLALRNERLADENAALALENRALLKRAASVSALSGSTAQRPAAPEILAGVVARPPESPYDILVLAGGSDDGIVLGMEAFGAGEVPLGVVSAVLADFSRVTLFSSPGMHTSGWVGEEDLPIVIRGAGAGVMNASVARSAGIIPGDIVFAPGPGQLPIGSVTRVDSDPSSPSAVLRIMPTLNLFSISWVALRDTGAAFRGALSSTTPTLP